MATPLVNRIQPHADRYQRLAREMALEHATSIDLENTRRELELATGKLNALKAELPLLQKKTRKNYENVRKMKHLSFRSAAATLSGKKKEKIAKEDAKYRQSFEAEQQCNRNLQEVTTRQITLSEHHSELRRCMDSIHTAKAEMTALLDEVFEAPHADFPNESSLKSEWLNYQQQLQLATRDKQRFGESLHSLERTSRDLDQVLDILASAAAYDPYNLFATQLDNTPYIEAAKRQTWVIQRRLNAVRESLPEIPHAELLDVVTHNPILSLQLQLTSSYMNIQVNAQQSLPRLLAARQHIRTAYNWVQGYDRYVTGAKEQLHVAIETAHNTLEAERRRIVDGVLSGTFADSSTVDHCLDPPPPVYEAPSSAIDDDAGYHPQVPETSPSPSHSSPANAETPPEGTRSQPPPSTNNPFRHHS